MSLTKLQTFLKKISRILYFTTEERHVQWVEIKKHPELWHEGMPEKVRVACDPVGLAIPLCIDYLIAREICDE